MKLRLMPIVITAIVASGLLFGGWFIYQSVAVENPLAEVVDNTPGVEKSQSFFGDTSVRVELQLSKDANIREVYQRISREGESIIGNRDLKLDIVNESSSALDEVWSKGLFRVAEAMETKKYADIPAALEQMTKSRPGMQVTTEMDEHNVYVRLTEGKSSKFVVLPRIPAQMGVWSNE
ncbi:hypothetical protein SY83_18365 [Paenibacillus swuensis]|uniref:Uncharacterized protein n=1 Tax=Paenibacillus swuensis TaxID=1178515 RepID=A0A172TLL5_9BACL|nr:hypothetical protein [Paenibacillus swuensis]ANE47931.1 hypothetical protein SY83_18365 [Paenibacillus swuensis]